MTVQRVFRQRKCAIAIGWLAIAVLVATFVGFSQAEAANSPGQTLKEEVYSVNQEGLTYGSLADAPSDDCEPDLIAAVATNGKEGYIRNSELAVASHENEPMEEAVKNQEAREQQAAKLLQKKLNAELDGDTIDLAEAKRVLENAPVLSSRVAEEGISVLSAEVNVPELNQLEADEVMECYYAVDEAMTQYIPVYLSDGKTVIGEFPVTQL